MQAAPHSVTAKIDKLCRPAAKRDMTEHEYKFFENEWTRYKRATNISGQLLIDELWNTMGADLKQLAFDQGDVDDLNTEELMLARIKSLAVTVQHAAVHTVALHSAQQHHDESTKAFAARVRGIASNCNLSKKSGCACNIDVSYLEETVYHVVLAGLKDRDLQERCTSQALLKNITDLKSLVAYCTADESGRIGSNATVGGFRRKSTYKRDGVKAEKGGQQGDQTSVRKRIGPVTADNRCSYCGNTPHSGQRRSECKAFNATCPKCKKTGHFGNMCQGAAKPPSTAAIAGQPPTVSNQTAPEENNSGSMAPIYFFGISKQPDEPAGFPEPLKLDHMLCAPPANRGFASGDNIVPDPYHDPLPNMPCRKSSKRYKRPPTLTGREQQPTWMGDDPHSPPGHPLYAPPAHRGCGPGETVVPIEPTLTHLTSSGQAIDSTGCSMTQTADHPHSPPGHPLYAPPANRGCGPGETIVPIQPVLANLTCSEQEKDPGSSATSQMGGNPDSPPGHPLYAPPAYRGCGPGDTVVPIEPAPSHLTDYWQATDSTVHNPVLATMREEKPGVAIESRRALPHMELFEDGWKDVLPADSPTMKVSLKLHKPSYYELGMTPPLSKSPPLELEVVADTGAQMCIIPANLAARLGMPLFKVSTRVMGATRESQLDIRGGAFLEISDPAYSCHLTTTQMFYVADNVDRCYLSLSCLKALFVVPLDFPRIGATLTQPPTAPRVQASTASPCSNNGVCSAGELNCSCPTRCLPPKDSPRLPCAATEANLPMLKRYILDRYRSSTFNTCEKQKLPLISGSPPLELHVDPTAKPVACHIPASVPLHWQEAVRAGLERDVNLGVLERVPLNTPARWQSRMVCAAKHDGSPRRTVDYGPLNTHCPRQTHHTVNPWHLATSIPEQKRKTVLDNWHGYHSLPLASEEDRALTTFVTPWGRYRYCTAPQGLRSSGDGFTDRMDRLFEDFERSRRCVDDTLFYDDTIEQQFFRTCEFLDRCGEHGIIINPAKFQFAEMEVDFVGFKVSATGVRPTDSFIETILSFPSPTNITDVRSWFGVVNQVSYSFASCPVMEPFRHLLSNKVPFAWSAELENAFQASKTEIVRQCTQGVRMFDPTLPTCLATDWSKFGVGYWLCQKRCSCQGTTPGCCQTGWQTITVGSRFCTQAEQNYAPIEGEAMATAWAAHKCRYFLLGLPMFALAVDHKPLIPLLGNKSLDLVTNPRIMNQRIKLLPYSYRVVHVPGKANVTPDAFSRRADSPVLPSPITAPIDLASASSNILQGYSTTLGPPSWVSGSVAHLAASILAPPSAMDIASLGDTESLVVGQALSSLAALATSAGQAGPRAVTWQRLQHATSSSPLCQSLTSLIRAGLPPGVQDWPKELLPYYPYRAHLLESDGVILCGERPLIPTDLRPEILETLHSGHAGVTTMLERASQALFWPSLKQDLITLRSNCQDCIFMAPSNPAPPPEQPVHPDFPFSHICMDFFQADHTYLAMVDRYSNWLSVFQLAKDDSANIIHVLRQYFARWGVAKEITSDGAPVFTSSAMGDFLNRWGVKHRVSSAYYPRANKRAELAVKSAKRLIRGNLGPRGSLNTDAFARALLEHRNAIDPLTGLSPAMIIFGREMKGFLPSPDKKFQPRQEWRLEADLREQAHAKRHARMEERLTAHARPLPPLQHGDTVAIQDLSDPCKPGKWTKTGTVVEALPYDSYMIRVDGSRRPTQRHRRHLRKLTTYSSLLAKDIPDTPPLPMHSSTEEDVAPKPTTRTPATDVQPPPTQPTIPTPTPAIYTPPVLTKPSAATHRHQPIASPGTEILQKLRRMEQQGVHLALSYE